MDCSKEPGAKDGSFGALKGEVADVESLLQSLHISKRPSGKQWRNNNHQSSSSSHKNPKNPFKHKPIRKCKRENPPVKCVPYRKTSVGKSNTISSEAVNNNKDKTTASIMPEITEKMALLWSVDGYRESSGSLAGATTTTPRVDWKKKNSLNITTAATDDKESGSGENHSQLSSTQSCARQAMYDYCDSSVTELAAYLDETLFIPRKMSFMAEMMYT